jgi:hypothetical protein
LIIGEDELAEKMIGIKALREDSGQISVGWSELGTALKQYIDNMGVGKNG